MKKKFRLYVGFLLMASGVCAMTACSGGEDSIANTTGGGSESKTDAVLTLTINAKNTSGSRATDMTTAPTTADENTINRLTIGLFDANNGVVGAIQEFPINADNSGSVKQTVVTSTLANKVLVAVNAPKDMFKDVKTIDQFKGVAAYTGSTKVTMDAGTALTRTLDATADDVKENKTNIPMFGFSDIQQSGSQLSATVNVSHLLAKITVVSVTCPFDANGSYANAKFIPKSLFLINVPNELYFNSPELKDIASDNVKGKNINALAWKTDASLLYGWGTFGSSTPYTYTPTTGNTSATPAAGTFKEYLTTSYISGDPTLTAGSGELKDYTFYTMPNGNDRTSKKNTKLVIAGEFFSDGTNSDGIVYYPVNLNVGSVNPTTGAVTEAESNTDPYKVYPNKNYQCTVKIKTKGAPDPYQDLDPVNAEITINVAPFVDVDQTTTFE